MKPRSPGSNTTRQRPRKTATRGPLYHLTPAENAEKIQAEGIVCADGEIFAFTDMIVANTIARDQVFARRYAVFRIHSKGITGPIEPDNVSEIAAGFQRLIRQGRIDAHYLSFEGIFETTDEPTALDFLIGSRLGRSPELVRAEFAVKAWIKEQGRRGELTQEQIREEANRRFKAAYEAHPPKGLSK